MGGPQPQQQGVAASHNRSFSQGNMLNQGGRPQEPGFGSEPNRNSAMPASRFSLGNSQGSSQGPPQLGALPFQNGPQQSPPLGQQPQGPPQGQQFQAQPPQQQFQSQQQRQQGPNPLQQHPPSGLPQGPGPQGPGPQGAGRGAPYQGGRPSPPAAAQPTPSRPVFGLPLSKLYERDGLAVPMVVYQCIQAVDLFGLGLEGIYRQSGSVNHINKLKQMFDTDSSNPLLDFRNPENFYHDVNSVTGLLKQFLRDLPDPLLTMEQHTALIESASTFPIFPFSHTEVLT
jgi:Rho GTPase-activating protein RGD1